MNKLLQTLQPLFEDTIFKPATVADLAQRQLIRVKQIVDGLDKTLLSNGSYDVKGNVDLFELDLDKLPIKFNKVGGNFWCGHNKLTILEGAPQTVGKDFGCGSNE